MKTELTLAVIYFCISYISHYEGLSFGSIIPEWICIFCLNEKLVNKLETSNNRLLK